MHLWNSVLYSVNRVMSSQVAQACDFDSRQTQRLGFKCDKSFPKCRNVSVFLRINVYMHIPDGGKEGTREEEVFSTQYSTCAAKEAVESVTEREQNKNNNSTLPISFFSFFYFFKFSYLLLMLCWCYRGTAIRSTHFFFQTYNYKNKTTHVLTLFVLSQSVSQSNETNFDEQHAGWGKASSCVRKVRG